MLIINVSTFQFGLEDVKINKKANTNSNFIHFNPEKRTVIKYD